MKNKKEELVFEGTLDSLRRGDKDIKEVSTGFECGIQCNGFSDWQIGDKIEVYKTVLKKKTLNKNKI
jgi:translation initiation factor IF-2